MFTVMLGNSEMNQCFFIFLISDILHCQYSSRLLLSQKSWSPVTSSKCQLLKIIFCLTAHLPAQLPTCLSVCPKCCIQTSIYLYTVRANVSPDPIHNIPVCTAGVFTAELDLHMGSFLCHTDFCYMILSASQSVIHHK